MEQFNSSTEATKTVEKYVSDKRTDDFVMVCNFFLLPLITFLGIIGNSLTTIIIFKQGFQTSTNVLLFSLALADLITLCGAYNIPELVYQYYGDNSFLFSERSARVWFIFYLIIEHTRNGLGYNVSMFLPMLITIERLVAVFLPLRFHQIMTPKRIALPVIVVSTFFVIHEFQSALIKGFAMQFDEKWNMTVGKKIFVNFYTEHYAFYVQNTVSLILFDLVPAIFTAIGCVIISVKIRLVSQKRKEMTSSSDSSISTSQTTKMMLAVCSVYAVVILYNFCTGIPQLVGVQFMIDGQWTNMGQLMMMATRIGNCFNSSCNFIIYVFFNKKFRYTLLTIIPCPCITRSESSLKYVQTSTAARNNAR